MRPPSAEVLLISLDVAVSLRIRELQDQSPEARELWCMAWAREAVDPIASQGDILQYGGGKKDRGEAAAVFGHLARGLAALAHGPGGVTFAGRHWCVDHDECTRTDGGSLPQPNSPTRQTRRPDTTIHGRPVDTIDAGEVL